MSWQPIETAPKDGTSILLLFEQGAIEGCMNEEFRGAKWSVIGLPTHGCGCCSEEGDDPTHWMPLPDDPI